MSCHKQVTHILENVTAVKNDIEMQQIWLLNYKITKQLFYFNKNAYNVLTKSFFNNPNT